MQANHNQSHPELYLQWNINSAKTERETHSKTVVEFVIDILPGNLKSCKKRSEKPVSKATQKASTNSNDWPEDQGHRQQYKHHNLQDKTKPLGSTIVNENRIKLQEQK